MKINQTKLSVQTQGRDTYEMTELVNNKVNLSNIKQGTCHIFIQHTSASLMTTECADPDVRKDLETVIQRLFPDADSEYTHTLEGPDDMSAHGRSMLTQTEITLPVTDGRLNLGTWQGIYLWEHRFHSFDRTLIITIMGI